MKKPPNFMLEYERIIEFPYTVDSVLKHILNENASIRQLVDANITRKCYDGCYVSQIIGVLGIGQVRTDMSGLMPTGVSAVIIKVKAMVLSSDDVITDLALNRRGDRYTIENDTMVGAINMLTNPLAKSVSPGMFIPVISKTVNYVTGTPKIHLTDAPMFRYMPMIIKCVATSDVEKVDAKIKNMRESRENAVKNIVAGPLLADLTAKIFPSEMYAAKMLGARTVDISAMSAGDMANILAGRNIMVLPPNPANLTAIDVAILDDSAQCMLCHTADYFIYNAAFYARVLASFSKTFTTAELIESHTALWQFYKSDNNASRRR